MQLARILDHLRQIAPEHLAEPWDKVGLQVGDPARDVKRALLCIDLNDAVLQEALRQQAKLIVSYHPVIFEPLTAVTALEAKQKLVLDAASHHMAIYCPHTALDAAAGGVNDWLSDAVLPGVMAALEPRAPHGATAPGGQIRAIRSTGATPRSRPYKLVTFVPATHLDRLRTALGRAGAGQIGDYSECSFNIEGVGTFRGGETTHPTVGQRGRLEQVREWRVEMVVPAERLTEVVAALMRTHPYEEPAFDLLNLELPPSTGGEGVGQGRVVTLDKPIALRTLAERVRKHLGVKHLQVATPTATSASRVRRVGLCAGAGGSLLQDAGAIDLFITGEMRHHDVLAALERGCAVILAGHSETERPYLKVYRDRLEQAAPGVTWRVSQADRPPLRLR